MSEKLSSFIETAATKTFEAMAFTEVRLAESPDTTTPPDSLAVHLAVLDPYQGSLALQASRQFITAIAENLLAMPSETITEKQLTDLLNELLNTIAGSFLALSLPDDITFSLGIPKPGLDKTETDTLGMCVWNFEADEGNFTLYGSGELIEQL